MRLSRDARNARRLPVQPVAVAASNYTLARFTVGKSGVIFGHNQYGSRWVEIHLKGITLLTYFTINNNPIRRGRTA